MLLQSGQDFADAKLRTQRQGEPDLVHAVLLEVAQHLVGGAEHGHAIDAGADQRRVVIVERLHHEAAPRGLPQAGDDFLSQRARRRR